MERERKWRMTDKWIIGTLLMAILLFRTLPGTLSSCRIKLFDLAFWQSEQILMQALGEEGEETDVTDVFSKCMGHCQSAYAS